MTIPTDDRPAAGTYVVHDPTLCEQLAGLLSPFRTGSPATPRAGGARERQALRDAEKRIAGLETELGQTQDLLSRSTVELNAERARHDEASGHLVAVETDLANTSRELAEARNELGHSVRARQLLSEDLAEAKAAATSAASDAARARDRKAFDALAARMEQQALSQSNSVADVLRLAARAVRDEIGTVYGTAKAAS